MQKLIKHLPISCQTEDIISHQQNILQNPQRSISKIQVRQPQLPHPTCPILRSSDATDPNPVHVHPSEEVKRAAVALIGRWGFLGFVKAPTFSGENPAKLLHGVNPNADGPRVERERAAVPVVGVAGGSGGVVGVVVGVEKDDLEGAWGEREEAAEVGQWGCGEGREGNGNSVALERARKRDGK